MPRSSTTFEKGRQDPGNNSPEAIKKANQTKSVHKLIRGQIYAELRKAICDSEGKAKPFYQEYIHKLCKEGLKDPNSPVGRLWAEQLLQQDIISMLDEQTEKMLNKDIDFIQFRLQKRLFKQQKEVFNDFVSPNIAVMCSRRAGKTENNADMICRTAVKSDSPILYINLTFENAIRQMFDRVMAEAERCELSIAKQSKSAGFINFSNGSSVLFKGNKDRSEADKMQGDKYRLVIIDEAQSQVNMLYLIDTIVRPMLSDYEDSQLILTGTPPRRKGTYFEWAFKNKEWTTYHWTMYENPYIKNVDAKIQAICNEKGVTRDSSLIQREFLGLIAYDTEAMMFHDYKSYKGVIPTDFIPTHIYTGVDFGFADYNGIVTIAANCEQKKGYVLCERKFNKATITEIIDAVRECFENGKKFLLERNQNADLANCSIYTDTNEKSITYELSQTYRLPAYCAYKYDRMMALEQMAEWCRTERLNVIEGGECAAEFEQVLYRRDETDAITSELDDSFHPDITFALLYATRQFFYDCGEDLGGESGNKQTGEF